jgi:hypothetical protein
MKKSARLPDLFSLLARASKIGVYSYEYEMLQAETLVYSKAEGLVANFIADGVLDLESFESAWLEIEAIKKLSVIAKKTMNVDDLTADPKLQSALFEAYRLGQSEPIKKEEVMSYSF